MALRAHWRRLGIGLGVVMFVGVLGWLWRGRSGGEVTMPPLVEMQPGDPAVAELVEVARAEALASPESGEAWGKLGIVLQVYDYVDEALTCFAEAGRLQPGEPGWPYYEAGLLLLQDEERALRLLRLATVLAKGDPDAPALKLAELLGERGEWEEAEAVYDELLGQRPGHAMALLGLARRRFAEGDDPECLRLLESCFEDERTRKAALTLAGAAQMRVGNRAEAAKLTALAARLPADSLWIDEYELETFRYRRGRRALIEKVQHLLQEQQVAEALPSIRELVKRYPDAAEGWLYLGRAQVLAEDYEGARVALRQHLDLEPGSVDGLTQMGLVLMRQGAAREAEACFERAIERKPDMEGGHFNLGLVRLALEDPNGALDAFRDAIRCQPTFAEAYIVSADVLVKLNRPDEAKAMLRKALEIDSSDERVQQRLTSLEGGK